MKKKYKNKNILKHQSGIALVEIIASLGVAVMAITALVSLSISTLRTSLESKLLLEGSKVANKQMELVRAYRDGRTWQDFITGVKACGSDSPCNLVGSTLSSGSGSSGSGSEIVYFQFIATDISGGPIPDPPPNVVRISVSTKWVIGDKVSSAYVHTDLSNWRLE